MKGLITIFKHLGIFMDYSCKRIILRMFTKEVNQLETGRSKILPIVWKIFEFFITRNLGIHSTNDFLSASRRDSNN